MDQRYTGFRKFGYFLRQYFRGGGTLKVADADGRLNDTDAWLAVRAGDELLVAPDAVSVLRTALALRGEAALKQRLAASGHAYVSNAHAPAIGERVAEAMLSAVKRRQETL